LEITVLLEKEGLSVYIREGDTRLLFDTGPDDSLLASAKEMRLDLSGVTALVLSHNHGDHTGGVMPLLKRIEKPLPVYAGTGFFREKYVSDTHTKISSLDKQYLVERDVTLTEVGSGPLPLGGRLYLLNGWDAPEPFEPANERYVLKEEDGWTVDPFAEETALVYEGQEELTMLCGCSHSGICGMVRKAVQTFDKPVHTLLGGVHLRRADEERLQKSAETLSELGVNVLGLSHCSGEGIGKVWKKKKYGAVAGFHKGDRVVVEVR
jgi:7,8-dihydropterin-6-yl-methyl-4-(beta-D-ribofuranosyl)aminobenzene 5'-phosphate synthase